MQKFKNSTNQLRRLDMPEESINWQAKEINQKAT
jgi:hypothetical protein